MTLPSLDTLWDIVRMAAREELIALPVVRSSTLVAALA